MAELPGQKMTLEQSRELLAKAAREGDLATVRKIVAVRAQNIDLVNTLSENEPCWGPIHFASDGGHVEIVELLIRKFNAQVDLQNKDGETALHLACAKGHKQVIERLLLAKAQTTKQDFVIGNTPLHILASLPDRPVSKCSGDCKCCGWRILDTNGQLKETQNFSTDRNELDESENIPRSVSPSALIDLILPFAEESKSMANSDGFMPW